VAILEIDRPPHNHVSVELMRDLADALRVIDVEKNLRASVVCSAGKAFCAGADLVSPTGVANPDAPSSGIGPLYEEAVRLFSIKKPIVVAVQGAAVGAGLGLALIGDFRVAAPEARFTANFVKLGFHPGFGITHTLPRVVGQQNALMLCLTGRRISGEEALKIGLVDQVVPLSELRGAALKLAQEIAENAPLAVQSTKATFRTDLAEAVRAQTAHELKEQTWLRQTNDFREGIKAVGERRPGNFTGT
jgi:enoyl-CoA hydratase/carnithine racemase